MRIAIVASVVVVVVVLGMVGLVIRHESNKQPLTVVTSGGGAKVETISRGEMVDIKAHLATGQWTVVEFSGEW